MDGSGQAIGRRRSFDTTVPRVSWVLVGACIVAYLLAEVLPVSEAVRAGVTASLVAASAVWACACSVLTMKSTVGKNRRLWRALSIALGSFSLAFAFRFYWVIRFGVLPEVGSFEDFAFMFGMLAMVPVVLLMTDSFEVSRLRKTRSVVDFLSVLTAALTLVYITIALPLGLFDPNGDWRANLLFLAFPVMAISYVAFLAAFKRGRWHTDEVLLFLAMLVSAIAIVMSVYAIAIVMSVYAIALVQLAPGDVVNSAAAGLLMTSFLLFGLAAQYRRSKQRPAKRDVAPVAVGMQWPGVMMQGLAIGAVPLLVFYASEISNAVSRGVLVVATAVLGALVVARGVLATIENQRLSSQALSDPLTGLFNDRYFRDRLRVEADHALADAQSLALCLIDFDGFDDFSREYGFAVADRRVKWFADVLLGWGRDADLMFRVGEDDFARIMPLADAQTAREECRELAELALEPPDSLRSRLTFSAGIAVMPDHTTDASELVRLAQGALYWAKTRGPGTIVVFDPTEVEALDSREHILRLREQTHTRLVESFAAAVDARDPYTKYHSLNVANLAQRIARGMGLDDERCALIEAAALLHDVGKIGVPDAILRKSSRLDPEEYAIVKQHPDLAVQILAASARPEMLMWIHQHHERPDGTGYPAGLTAEQITLEARILSVCDAFDAITTERPYRRAAAFEDACEELRRNAGTQFDAQIVEQLCRLVSEGGYVAETMLASDVPEY